MPGIGRERGSGIDSPTCRRRNSTPASIRASAENGGVLISPCSHTNGLSDFGMEYYMSDMTYSQAGMEYCGADLETCIFRIQGLALLR